MAVAIRSLDPTLGLLKAGAQCAPYKLCHLLFKQVLSSTLYI